MTAACPACVGVADGNAPAAGLPDLQLSVPGIHCAACIAKIERRLATVRGVHTARVNLSLKRLSVSGPAQPEDVLKAVQSLGYEVYALDGAVLEQARDRAGRDLLMRMAVAGFAMMNVMLLSVAIWSGADGATRDLFHLISAAIAVPVVFYSGQPFFQSAGRAVLARQLNMDVPIALAILLATGMSLFESLNSGQHAYFDAALSLTFFLLIGRYLDHRTRSAARSAAKELSALEAHYGDVLRAGKVTRLPLDQITEGDLVWVPSGGRVPVDGILQSDGALLDRSLLTGESAAVAAGVGTALQAGEINLAAPFTLQATAVGADTTLRRVAALVETAENGRNRYTALADRAAQLYAPAVHLLALLAFVCWWAISGDLRLALNIAIAVLIITCPCALGLAVPAVSTAAISRLFHAGFLVKHATALERLAEVDHAVFDKTGTLSRPSVTVPAQLPAKARGAALALAQSSRHPMAQALVNALEGEVPAKLDSIREVHGQGVTAFMDGRPVVLGQGAWIGAEFSGLGLRIGDDAPWAFKTSEVLRPGVLQALRGLDLPAEILTGDTEDAALVFADQTGLPVTARATPQDKADRLDTLNAMGHRTLMVGDGLNDTLALAKAHASLAPATALDASRAAADVVLLKDDFADIPLVLRIARATRKISTQNFTIAGLYNMVAIPIALAGFATPLIAALAMSASSITVVLNAQRIRYVK